MSEQKHVWYVSYGSNLNWERFRCYIEGGTPAGSNKEEVGCVDKAHPLDDQPAVIFYPLYFAQSAARWDNKGVAFIGPTEEPQQETLARRYLITEEQFRHIFDQENNRKLGTKPSVDFQEVIKQKSIPYAESSWYGNVVYLGKYNTIPSFTFTSGRDWRLENAANPPAANYLKQLIKGIKDSFQLSPQQIVQYFINKPGIHQHYTAEQLLTIIRGV